MNTPPPNPSTTITPCSNGGALDDLRVYHSYSIGQRQSPITPTTHLVLVNWGTKATQQTVLECFQALVKLLPTHGLSFCRVGDNMTFLSFQNQESATGAYTRLISPVTNMSLGRTIKTGYCLVTYKTTPAPLPHVSVTWSTYVKESTKVHQESKNNHESDPRDGDQQEEEETIQNKATTQPSAPAAGIPYVPGLTLALDAINAEEEKILVAQIYAQGDKANNNNNTDAQHSSGWCTCARKRVDKTTEGDARAPDPPFSIHAHRRVMHFGHRFEYNTRGVGQSETGGRLPPFLQSIVSRIRSINGAEQSVEEPEKEGEDAFDQCTVNEYKPGHGIAPHVDTHSAFGSMLVSLSLLSATTMTFVHCVTGHRLDLILPPRSMLILTKEARYAWTHCVAKRSMDLMRMEGEEGSKVVVKQRATRVSLTFRRLRRVEEGPCTCAFPGVWCDSSQNIK